MDQTVNNQAINQKKMALARGVEPADQAKKKPLHQGLRIGAGTTNRTRDLLITSQLLYQLSYAGNFSH